MKTEMVNKGTIWEISQMINKIKDKTEGKNILNRFCILLIVACSMMLSSAVVISAADPILTYDVTVDVSPIAGDIYAGNSYVYNITVNNTGNTRGNYTLGVSDSDIVNFSSVLSATIMEINNGSSVKATLTVSANIGATVGTADITTVKIDSVEKSMYTDSAQVETIVVTSPTPSGGPDCLSCHNDRFTRTHKDVNSLTTASGVDAANKKCWGCHQSDGKQPTEGSMGDRYNNPYQCADCHDSDTKPYPEVNNAPTVGNENAKIGAINNGAKSQTNMGYTTSAATVDKRHNGTIECDTCHNNPELDDIGFIQPNGIITYDKATAAKCPDCHMTGTVQAGNSNFSTAYILTNNKFSHSAEPNNGSIWTRSGDPNYWSDDLGACKYCHGNATHSPTPIGKALVFKDTNVKREFGTWCTSCHYQGYSLYSAMLGKMAPVPPEFAGDATYGNYVNIKYFNHGSIGNFQDTKCKSCHGGGTELSVLMHGVTSGEGGPDCVSCHDVSAGGNRPHVNVSSMNRTDSIHKDLNNGVITLLNPENKRCWSCHGDGNEPTKHPLNYKTPYTCTDCHAGSNRNFAPPTILSVSEHFWNGDQIKTNGISSCYRCHNKSEMMIIASDPDVGSGDVNGGLYGGDNSTSHYGKKRADLVSMENTVGYCKYCHNSSVLPFGPFSDVFLDANNTHISNHSTYGTNPSCSACHNNGRIHDAGLTFDPLTLPTSAICLPCHGPGGSAAIKDKSKHNGAVECSLCHLETGKDIHPIKYLNSTDKFTLSRGQGAKCDTCHESGKHGAPVIGKVRHSTNPSNGSLWNAGRPSIFWGNTVPSDKCDYCHGDTKHKADALGKPAIFKGTNAVNVFGNWCGTCHYKNNGQYGTMIGVMSLLIPPEVSKHSTYGNYVTASDGTPYYNHSLGPYSDEECKYCHSVGTPSNLTTLMHNVEIGGTSCIGCHTIPGTNYFMDTTKLGKHVNVSKSEGLGIVSDDDCKGCHFDVISMDKMLPGYASKTNTYYCQDCHKSGGRNAAQYNSMPANLKIDTFQHAKNDCEQCHINNGVSKYHPGGPIGTAFDNVTNTARNCYSCHYRSDGNGDGGANIGMSGPFRAPGEDHTCDGSDGTRCHGSNEFAGFARPPLGSCSMCHGAGNTHSVGQGGHDISGLGIGGVTITSPVNAGTASTVRTTAYNLWTQMTKAQYRIMDDAGTGLIRDWQNINAEDGTFDNKGENIVGSIDTTGLSGIYTINVRAMSSGHRSQTGGMLHSNTIPYYPDNGAWTKIVTAKLTVTGSTGPTIHKILASGQLYYPGSWRSHFKVGNAGNTANVNVSFYNGAGTRINTTTTSITRNTSADYQWKTYAPGILDGTALINSTELISAITFQRADSDGRLGFWEGVPLNPQGTDVFVPGLLYHPGSWRSGFKVLNTESLSTIVDIYFYNGAGTQINKITRTIQPKTSPYYDWYTYGYNITGGVTDGTVRIVSTDNRRIHAVATQAMNTAGKLGFWEGMSLNSQNTDVFVSGLLYYPGVWRSGFKIANYGTSAASATIYFYNPTGTQINSITITIQPKTSPYYDWYTYGYNITGGTNEGTARIVVSNGQQIKVIATQAAESQGMLDFYQAPQISGDNTAFVLYQIYDGVERSGFKIANPATSTISATVRFYNSAGTQVNSVTNNIAAKTSPYYGWNTYAPGVTSGSATVEANGRIVVVVSMASDKPSTLGIFRGVEI